MACGEVTGRKPSVSADRVKQASGPPIPNEIAPTPHAEGLCGPALGQGSPDHGCAPAALR